MYPCAKLLLQFSYLLWVENDTFIAKPTPYLTCVSLRMSYVLLVLCASSIKDLKSCLLLRHPLGACSGYARV